MAALTPKAPREQASRAGRPPAPAPVRGSCAPGRCAGGAPRGSRRTPRHHSDVLRLVIPATGDSRPREGGALGRQHAPGRLQRRMVRDHLGRGRCRVAAHPSVSRQAASISPTRPPGIGARAPIINRSRPVISSARLSEVCSRRLKRAGKDRARRPKRCAERYRLARLAQTAATTTPADPPPAASEAKASMARPCLRSPATAMIVPGCAWRASSTAVRRSPHHLCRGPDAWWGERP